VPRYVDKVVETWETVTRDVPRYVTRKVQDGWDYVTKVVKKPVVRKVLATAGTIVGIAGATIIGASTTSNPPCIFGYTIFLTQCQASGLVPVVTPLPRATERQLPTIDPFFWLTPTTIASTPIYKTPTPDLNRFPTVTRDYGATLTPQIYTANKPTPTPRVGPTPQKPSDKEIQEVEDHLAQFGYDDLNDAMIKRLKAGHWTPWEQRFVEHELLESKLMKEGMDYDTAHKLALSLQGITYEPGYEAYIYHPDVVDAFPDQFSSAAREISKQIR